MKAQSLKLERSRFKSSLPATATAVLPTESPIRDIFLVTMANVIGDPQLDSGVHESKKN